MAQPQRKPRNEDPISVPRTARNKADERWGMSPDRLQGEENAGDEGYSNPLIDSDLPSARERADERWGMGNGAIGKEEASPEIINDGGINSAINGQEQSMLESAINNPAFKYTPGTSSSGFGRVAAKLTKNNRAIPLGMGGLAGIIFFLVMMIGPLKIPAIGSLIDRFHFQDNAEFLDGRSSKIIRYLRSGSVQTTRLGVIGTRYAKKWDAKLTRETGLRSVYADGTKRFIGYEVIDESKARPYLNDMDNDGVNTNGTRNGRRFIDVSNDGFGERRSLIRTVTKGLKIKGVPQALSSRLLGKYGGVGFHPLRNLRIKQTDKVVNWVLKVREERAKRLAQGVTEPDIRGPTSDNDGDGVSDSTADGSTEGRASADASDLIDDIAGDGALPEPTSPDFAPSKASARLKFGAKIAGSAAAAVGVMCGVKALGATAELTQYTNTILPMARVATSILTMKSQIESGEDVSSDEVAVHSKELYDELNKTDVLDAAPFQATLYGKNSGPDLDTSLKPGKLNEKPLLFRILDDVPFLSQTCDLQETVSGLPVLKQMGEVSSMAVDTLLSTVGLSQEELLNSVVDVLAGSSINYYAVGAELGNYIMYGARISSNITEIAVGAKPLTEEDENDILVARAKDLAVQNKSKSLFERYLDSDNIDSLMSKTAMSMPRSLSLVSSQLFTNPLGMFSFLSPKASAASYNFDYGIANYGFSLAEQQSAVAQDPFENAAVVESKLAELDASYGSCFPKRIELGTFDMIENNLERVDSIDEKCNNSSVDLLRYRLYLADRVTESSLGCFEGDGKACAEIGVSSGLDNSNQTATSNGIFVLGDSLTVGMQNLAGTDAQENYLERQLTEKGWRPTINAQGCRSVFQPDGPILGDGSSCPSQTIVDGLTAVNDPQNLDIIKSSDTFVIALGTNGRESSDGEVLFREKATQLIADIRSINPSANIYWLNLHFNPETPREVNRNAIINQLVEELRINLLDWDTFVNSANTNGAPVSFADSVHHDSSGYVTKTSFLVEGVGTPPQNAGSLNIIRGQGSTDHIPCGAGTDLGVYDGYDDGVAIDIKLCDVQGIEVNSQIAKSLDDMLTDASEQGIDLVSGTSSYRTIDSQISLWQQRCGLGYPITSKFASPPCQGASLARPGRSMHQLAMAMDFNCDGSLIPQSYSVAQNNKCFAWLDNNASNYGFYEWGDNEMSGTSGSRGNSLYEGWHWSVNGN
jgi:hypothetical protein